MPEQHHITGPSTLALRVVALVTVMACVALFLLVAGSPGPPTQGKSVDQTAQSQPIQQGFQRTVIGRDCQQCHRAIVESFAIETHGKSAKFLKDSRGSTCDSCHGNGEKHVETSSPTRNGGNIINPATQTSALANEFCLQCHSRDRYLFDWRREARQKRHELPIVSQRSPHQVP